MRRPVSVSEARLRRARNQRRAARALVERCRPLLAPGVPFDREFARLLRRQKGFGAADRRLYRELVYAYLRYEPWLEPLRAGPQADPEAFDEALIRLAAPIREVQALYPTLRDGPPPADTPEGRRHRLIGKSDEDLGELLPAWFRSNLPEAFSLADLKALFRRPPLWLRAQGVDAETLARRLAEEAPAGAGASPEPFPALPGCLRAPADFPLSRRPAFAEGLVEPQDVGSQALLRLLAPPPRGRWLDACAGAGGKTLQLACLLGPGGAVVAHDRRPEALEELRRRRARAGLANIDTAASLAPQAGFDGVLVDAPCSGSGTWRRHPYLMRQTAAPDLRRHAERQLRLLRRYADFVAPGGRLVYATCSLSPLENQAAAAAFLEQAAARFEPEPLAPRFGLRDKGQGVALPPSLLDGDAFYVACFRRLSQAKPPSKASS